jgi:hypothetical protein
MQDFEKLGVFYLGRLFSPTEGKSRDELLLYDAKDLTTHAMCVGMTGSGKTGLCLSLLEEAAIDGIPAIAIDPKGDLGNLALAFPELRANDFQPWIDQGEATRAGMTVDQYAKKVAETWKQGLADWGQDGARIARFRDSVDLTIYTPGSNYGLPLTLLRSFDAPPAAVLNNSDAFRERILTAVSGLIGLLGIDPDPIRSREHILLSNIFDRAWREGRNLDMAGLIREIQHPSFNKIGVMDLETIFPANDRFGLSMQLNNLLASPGFAGWLEGEPLDIQRLYYTSEGKPRLTIISIAHLSDAERMFFVTTLLNEVVSWMRAQSGTSSLRALLYMDEVFGYFPPTANPPSKLPMLTLLKQARAFGLGIVLATQNPVDLDYKGLSNCGTWFLGRLQTERDKARVIEGLEGACTSAGKSFDRQAIEKILSGLGNRTFLMNNVHDDGPVVFQTRWVMSYLRGPLTRNQIETLMQPLKATGAQVSTAAIAKPCATLTGSVGEHPVIPPGIEEVVLAPTKPTASGQQQIYRPALFGRARLHYVQASASIDSWRTVNLVATIDDAVPDEVWEEAECFEDEGIQTDNSPDPVAKFADLPSELTTVRNYAAWKTSLKNYLQRSQTLRLYECAALKQKSRPDESEGDFRVRLKTQAAEQRDIEIEKLRKKYAPKLTTLQDRLRRAEASVEREKSQASQQTLTTALNMGTTLLGALFGRKMASASNVSRAASSVRSASKIAKERADIGHAQDTVESVQQQLAELEAEFQQASNELKERFSAEQLAVQEIAISPRKSDLTIEKIALAWTPWRVDSDGRMKRTF